MSKRTAVSAGELYVILDREFRLRRARECSSCYVLLPFRIDQSDVDSANWELPLPPDCGNGCAEVLDDLVQKYSTVYDLARDDRA